MKIERFKKMARVFGLGLALNAAPAPDADAARAPDTPQITYGNAIGGVNSSEAIRKAAKEASSLENMRFPGLQELLSEFRPKEKEFVDFLQRISGVAATNPEELKQSLLDTPQSIAAAEHIRGILNTLATIPNARRPEGDDRHRLERYFQTFAPVATTIEDLIRKMDDFFVTFDEDTRKRAAVRYFRENFEALQTTNPETFEEVLKDLERTKPDEEMIPEVEGGGGDGGNKKGDDSIRFA